MDNNIEELINKVYCGDCRDIMKTFPDECIDLVITSPPYSNLRTYNNTLKEWNEEVFKSIADQLYRVVKPGGVIVWIVNDKTEKGSKTLTSFKQALYFQEIGFGVNDIMVWEKLNPCPSVRQPRYSDTFEYMMVFSKGKPKTFNPIMIPCKCAGVNYNSTCKNIGGENGRTKKNFKINKTKVKGNVWGYGIAQNKTKHPAVFPETIVNDHIKSWSNEGDVVLDPFIGSGTTALSAIKNNRKYIGIDINQEYIDMSNERINDLIKNNE